MIGHRSGRGTRPVGPGSCPLLGDGSDDSGEQFRRGCTSQLRGGRRAGRGADGQVGRGDIHPGIEQPGDDADQPGVAC
ncbi:hypothetical protein SDC9_141259 [bioreactor metagenome]|uniref:Uncharacterized protein n=1 Tax=bioreactor metagenome TaxID=1076179 RepID=A0A645DXP5_9ZZZZ